MPEEVIDTIASDPSAVPRPTAVHVNLPVDWLEVPLDQLDELPIDDLANRLGLEANQRLAVESFFLEAQQIYLDAPAVFAAMYALFDDDGEVVLLLSMVVLIDVFPADDTPALDLVDALTAESEDLLQPVLVETPIGSAVRAHVINEPDPDVVAAARGTELEPYAGVGSFSTQYFIPILGREHMAVVAFTSPNVEVREALTPLFDDIVETVRFRWPAPPRVTATTG